MLLAVTTVEVVAIAHRTRVLPPRRIVWGRAELLVDVVALRIGRLESGRAAVLLSAHGRPPRLELAALTHDDATVQVLELLGVHVV